MVARIIFMAFVCCFTISPTAADEQDDYSPAKVVYDVSSSKIIELNHILDRVSLLQNIYGNNPFEASIVIVVHEGAIPLFTKSSQSEQKEFLSRADSLTMGEIIEFRVCRASARMQGFEQKDFPNFIQMVPMADGEIVKLQNKGYAYLR